MTEIKNGAFANCKSIESVYLPASLKSIKADALKQEHKFSVYVVKDSYADTQLVNMTNVEYMDKKYQ